MKCHAFKAVAFAIIALGVGFVYQPETRAQPQAQQPLQGKLVSAGSDTLGSLSSYWAERLRERHPQVLVQVRAIGSGAAPTALIQGTADVGPMSRPMAPAERQRFYERYGYAPTPVPVAADEIATFVHLDNPLDQISLAELDALFSSTRRCGFPQSLRDWRDLTAFDGPRARPVNLYGRSAASGTHSIFRQKVMCGGDFAPRVNRLVGSSAIVNAVAADPDGIGYASGGYVDARVKALRIVDVSGGRELRLERELILYVNQPPGEPLEALVAAYLDLVLSSEGQRDVVRAGYRPLSRSALRRARDVLGLDRG